MAKLRSAVLVFALVAVTWAAAPPPRTFLAVFKTESVREGASTVSVGFSARIFNMGRSPARFATVALSDAKGEARLAEWHDVAISPEDKVEVRENVAVGREEYRRWRSGGPAVLLVVPAGVPGAPPSRLDATLQPSGW